jgi:hypothetical protein
MPKQHRNNTIIAKRYGQRQVDKGQIVSYKKSQKSKRPRSPNCAQTQNTPPRRQKSATARVQIDCAQLLGQKRDQDY